LGDALSSLHHIDYCFAEHRAATEYGELVEEVGSEIMRGLATILVVLLALGGIFCYLVLPGVVENQLAQRLQGVLGAPTKPDVEVSSSFPPELLLGRIDRIQVRMDQANLQGVAVYDAQADLKDVKVSVPSLLEGNPTIETQSCSIRADTPPIFITQNQACVGYLGLGAGY
jgi:hypothetical protein